MVADADAAVEKARNAGGKVVTPPYGIPRFRTAVLADPQGAVFTVAQPMWKT
jgi:predicted enzyme related to lactoylglutathione lyase